MPAAMGQNAPKIVVIGTGHWGKNHVRNFANLEALAGVYDADVDRRKEMANQYGLSDKYTTLESIMKDPEVSGVVIASPAETHYEVAKMAIEAGKDAFVEKPVALRYGEARDLVDLAKKHERILMVGHLLQYHPAVVKLKELVSSGELGNVEYIYSNRLNLGKIRSEENILWSFAPHDISIMLWLTESMPVQVNAVGGNYLQPNVADTTISTYIFDNGVQAHIYVSWLHPFKEQRLVVVGSKKMAVFDDRAPKGEKLLMFDKNIEHVNGQFVAKKPEGKPVSFNEDAEPLRSECEHFLNCIQTREQPRTDGNEGARVLKVLQSGQRSLQMNGQPVQVLDYRD